MAALARNGGRGTALSVTQLYGFFEPTRLLAVAQSRTSMIGKHILYLGMSNMRLVLMDTTIGDFWDTSRGE